MSYPINQVFLGSDPMMGSGLDDLDAQIRKMEAYRNKLRQMQGQQQPQKLIWDEIDAEIIPMTEEQKQDSFKTLSMLRFILTYRI